MRKRAPRSAEERTVRATLPRKGLDRDGIAALVRDSARRVPCETIPRGRPRSTSPADVGRYVFPYFLGVTAGQGEELRRIERELETMALDMLGLPQTGQCVLTSSGTESIFLAMLLAKRTAKYRGGEPEIVVADNLHPCIQSAAESLGIIVRTTSSDTQGRADVGAFEAAINGRTILLVASAATWGRGVLDPVEGIVRLGASHEIACHVDGCSGALLVPFLSARRGASLARSIAMLGQTSISIALHKYAYAPSNLAMLCAFGAGGVEPIRFTCTDWDGFRYVSHSVGGERPAAPVVAAWAVMQALGRNGYRDLAARIVRMRRELSIALRRLPVDLSSEAETAVLAVNPRGEPVETLSLRLSNAGVPNLACLKPGFVRIRIDPLWSDRRFGTILNGLRTLSSRA